MLTVCLSRIVLSVTGGSMLTARPLLNTSQLSRELLEEKVILELELESVLL